MSTQTPPSTNFVSYEQKAVLETLPFDPFAAIVGPRPIGWMGTCSTTGVANIAPYSFFNGLNHDPALLGFASIGFKDTLTNIRDTGEFTWNLASRDIAEKMNMSSVPVGPEVDEFDLVGLTKAPSTLIAAPRVAEAPVSLECRLCDIIQLKGSNGTLVDTWFVYGEVVYAHIRQDMLTDGVYDTVRARPVLRGGGLSDFFEIIEASRFPMRKPEARHI